MPSVRTNCRRVGSICPALEPTAGGEAVYGVLQPYSGCYLVMVRGSETNVGSEAGHVGTSGAVPATWSSIQPSPGHPSNHPHATLTSMRAQRSLPCARNAT
eukprot:9494055-Pyramimonas_sp.AAC.1